MKPGAKRGSRTARRQSAKDGPATQIAPSSASVTVTPPPGRRVNPSAISSPVGSSEPGGPASGSTWVACQVVVRPTLGE